MLQDVHIFECRVSSDNKEKSSEKEKIGIYYLINQHKEEILDK